MSGSGPKSVGIIMDGNRRWAKARGLSSVKGHEAGKEALLALVRSYAALRERWGTEHYIFYAFSTENWNRAAEEVAALMGIFERAFTEFEKELPQLLADGVRIRFVGERERFSVHLQELMHSLEEKTAEGAGTIAFAVSYGGHADILHAANAAAASGLPITQEAFEKHLWTAGIPEPDLIIRTGGEQRLSNFLSWQSAYSELYFYDVLWPEFTGEHLEEAFRDFSERERRGGK